MTEQKTSKCPTCLGTGLIFEVGSRIKKARDQADMGRSELADKTGLTYQTIRNIEQGITKPSQESIKLISTVFESLGISMH